MAMLGYDENEAREAWKEYYMEEGMEKGIEAGKIDMVLKMLKANQPIELIRQFSDFTKDKIIDIAKLKGISVNA